MILTVQLMNFIAILELPRKKNENKYPNRVAKNRLNEFQIEGELMMIFRILLVFRIFASCFKMSNFLENIHTGESKLYAPVLLRLIN